MAESPQLPLTRPMWYIRVKDVGTRTNSVDVRNKNILERMQLLPEGNFLPGRSIYWFVTMEAVDLSYEDAKSFICQESLVVQKNGVDYYLKQVNFVRTRRAILTVTFPNGDQERINCYSKKPNSSAVISPITDRMDLGVLPEYQFGNENNTNLSIEFPNTFSPEISSDVSPLSPRTPESSFSQNKRMKINHEPETGFPSYSTPGLMQVLAHNTANYNSNNNNNANITPPRDVVQSLPDNVQLSQNNTNPVHVYHNTHPRTILNILLLVPDRKEYIEAVDQAMKEIGFMNDVISSTNQRLYRDADLVHIENNILLFPYGDMSRIKRVPDYLVAASEVLLMLENDGQQPEDFMAIQRVKNIGSDADEGGAIINWDLMKRGSMFKSIELDYKNLNNYVGVLVPILQESVTGGAIWKCSMDIGCLKKDLELFLVQWILRKHGNKSVPAGNIYLCFKYEKDVKPLSEYAAITLKALGVNVETFVAFGSALVYLKCPSYMPWYILLNEERIARELTDEGLKEIYECSIKDIDASLQRPDNHEFIEELTYLKEMMIADGIEEQIVKRFKVVFGNAPTEPKVNLDLTNLNLGSTIDSLTKEKRLELEKKFDAMKAFDNKWTVKTLEDCYNRDRLKKQLFGFNPEKNAFKFAVRVFLSSASAGMATNVAKLMRQFNGKSIVDGVHSGLQIANTIVEWNQSGLVHIGELKHTSATAVLFDVQDSVKFDFSDEIANKMINFIQRWNVEHQYDAKEYNSHRFVRDFLQETLNVSLVERFKGPLGLYMDYVMNTYDATPRLISKSHGTMVFKTHKDLEEVDRAIRDELTEDEVKLLKIFHRGFQLQEAAHGKDVSSCCYGLPTNGLEILNDSGKPMKY